MEAKHENEMEEVAQTHIYIYTTHTYGIDFPTKSKTQTP